MTETVSIWQSAIWLAIKRLQIIRYSLAVSPEMLLSTSSGVRAGMDGRMASWASWAAVALLVFQVRLWGQIYCSP